MKNRIAISIAVATLLVAVVALGATIATTLADSDSTPEPVAPQEFVAVGDDVVAPGQKKAEDDAEKPDEEDDAAEKADAEENDAPKMKDDDQLSEEARANLRRRQKVREARKRARENREDWKSAVLQVVTNFDQADVKVNGLDYPEYYAPGEPQGMVLPAGGPYDVEVKFGENTKHYRLNLRPYETRLLFVELSGFNSSDPPPRRAPKRKAKKKEKKKDDDDKKKSPGKITVYSKPPGVIIVDGAKQSEKTPGSVELDNGRHEVQVQYESGSMSEKKIVRVRTGSRIKLFFRERK